MSNLSEKFERASALPVGGVTQVASLDNEAANDSSDFAKNVADNTAQSQIENAIKVQMGNTSPNGETASNGVRLIDAVRNLLDELDPEERKKKRDRESLRLALKKVNEFLDKITTQISELKNERTEVSLRRDGLKAIQDLHKKGWKDQSGNDLDIAILEVMFEDAGLDINDYLDRDGNLDKAKLGEEFAKDIQIKIDKETQRLNEIDQELAKLEEQRVLAEKAVTLAEQENAPVEEIDRLYNEMLELGDRIEAEVKALKTEGEVIKFDQFVKDVQLKTDIESEAKAVLIKAEYEKLASEDHNKDAAKIINQKHRIDEDALGQSGGLKLDP